MKGLFVSLVTLLRKVWGYAGGYVTINFPVTELLHEEMQILRIYFVEKCRHFE